jgi:hypothetical protein
MWRQQIAHNAQKLYFVQMCATQLLLLLVVQADSAFGDMLAK